MIVGGKALSDVLVGRFGEVAGDLVVDVAIHPPSTKEGPRTKEKDPQASHETSSEILEEPLNEARRPYHRASSSGAVAPSACPARRSLTPTPALDDAPHLDEIHPDLLQLEQRRIQGALVERQPPLPRPDPFDSPGDAITMQRAQGLECLITIRPRVP